MSSLTVGSKDLVLPYTAPTVVPIQYNNECNTENCYKVNTFRRIKERA